MQEKFDIPASFFVVSRKRKKINDLSLISIGVNSASNRFAPRTIV